MAFKSPKVMAMLFLGFSAGLPILLIFSSLSLWLREAGVERSAVTFFSWAALGYSFKFVWAPLVDKLPLPLLTRWLGRRRGWLLLAQIAIAISIVAMALVDPSDETRLTWMALAAVALGFSSATQDVVIDAYRIEAVDSRVQGMMSASYIAGYRVGMIVAGAGALFLASGFGSTMESYSYQAWQWSYLIMALVMLVGMATTLAVSEPKVEEKADNYPYPTSDYLQLLLLFAFSVTAFALVFFYSGALATIIKQQLVSLIGLENLLAFVIESLRLVLAVFAAYSVAKIGLGLGVSNKDMVKMSYVAPVKNFFGQHGIKTALLLLALIGCYRMSDIVLGIISNVFYQDMSFSKQEIAWAVKTFGVMMAVLGGFLGGLLSMRYGVMRILFIGAILSALTNLLFIALASAGHDLTLLYLVISADNLSAGLASAAFVAFLSSLTNVSFTAMQYALFSSLMTLLPKFLGGYSGTFVATMGYSNFFILTTLLGLPVLVLIVLAKKHLALEVR
ncbi:MAG: MFS transporter [Pseudomonadales bacterium]